jgi:myosin heavy subunit
LSSSLPFQTNAGDILVAVNPFEDLKSLYDPARFPFQAADEPSPNDVGASAGVVQGSRIPHIYSLVRRAYKNLMENRQKQCVLIR